MPPDSARRSRARKLAVVGSLAAGSVLAVWLMVAAGLFYFVPHPPPHRTDAVIMLGGSSSERLPEAQRLQDSLGIPVLALSHTGQPGNLSADQLCEAEEPYRHQLLCFHPSVLDTRGEASTIGQLVAEHGWTSITVVTSRYHVTRASTLIRQCTSADVQMVATNPDLDPLEWLGRFVTETGGLISAKMFPACPAPVR